MCGILGTVEARRPVDADRVRRANELMRTRGPDGAGEFFEQGATGGIGLAMRRLAVIDLAGGAQPLTARGGRVVAFQNGEIYDHEERRRELESAGVRFTTRSDTEVLAQGFATWGMEGLLARIDGMFALAILERDEGVLWLARDRFGEKPLFVAQEPERLHFASSLAAIGALRGRPLELDPRALDDYLALHYCPGRRTIFRDVVRVLPGELWRIDVRTLAVERRRWWRLPLAPPRAAAADSVQRSGHVDDELRARLDHAVRSRLVADVPVGVFLSGGLDSSLVAALAARARKGIATFSMGFAGSAQDESPFADLVARHVGSDHHHFQFDASSFQTLFREVAATLDEPVGDPAQLPLFWLCREARRHATVVLSGEGADELFGGYDYYARFAPATTLRERFDRWRSTRSHRSSRDLPTRLLEHDGRAMASGFPLVLDRAQRRALFVVPPDPTPDAWEQELLMELAAVADPLQRASAADLLTWLPDDLLVKFDRMAMGNSLEGRAPYLEPRLAELALALPPQERATVHRRKVALARAARPLLPRAIVERRKHGFLLPMQQWLAELFAGDGGARWLADRPLPLLDAAKTGAVIDADLAVGVRRARALFSLALLHEWHAAFRARERQWLAACASGTS